MPKIPTFQAKGRITAEAAGVRTGIQVSPFQTPAGELSKVAKVAEDYYIKQRDNNEKLEAKKKFYEMKSESDKIIESQKNNADEFQSVEVYNQEFGEYRKQQLSQIKNKRVKKRLETLLDIDQAENVYTIKKNSFNAFETNSNEIYNQEQNSLGVKRTLETDPNKRKQIQDQQIESAREYENMHGMGDAWLNEETKKIIGDNELFDVEKAVARKDYGTALNLLKKSTSIDQDDVEKQLIKIEEESQKFYKIENIKDALLNNRAWLFESKDRDEGISALAETGQYDDAKLSQISISNNATYDVHKNTLAAGFSNAATTGNPSVVRAGYETYKLYKQQGGLPYLKNGMKITDEQLDFYSTIDFMVDTMGSDIRSVMTDYGIYYKNRNNPEVKSIVPNETKVKSTASSIANNFFTDDADNVDEIQNLVRRYSTILLRIRPTDQDQIMNQVQKRIESNFKVDAFGQLTAIKPHRPDTHDVSLKAYIKYLYDNGRINKEVNDLDDLIAVDIDPTSTTSISGVRIINKKFPTTPVLFKPAEEDFDTNEFEIGIFTDKQLEQVIYPFGTDARWESWKARQKARKLEQDQLQAEIIASKTGILLPIKDK